MMQIQTTLLILVTAHLAGDFVFQTSAMVQGKKRGAVRSYLAHGGAHLGLTYLLATLFDPIALREVRFHFLAAIVIAAHLGLDWLKERKLSERLVPAWLGYVVDQAGHLGTIVLATSLFSSGGGAWLAAHHRSWLQYREPLLWSLAIYLATVFGGGYFIRVLLSGRTVNPTDDPAQQARREDEKRVGMQIGWLERFVILTAIAAKSPTAVGLILAAKSIVRFKKVEADDEFAEYFLLGTFLSVALALVGGLALRWLLFGQLDLE